MPDDRACRRGVASAALSVNLRKEGGKGVQRRDCAVGLLSDDCDYRERGISRVTFIRRMKPETHHSKAGSMKNYLLNEGADGTYLLILDNDMKPHLKFLLAVLLFCSTNSGAVVLLLGRRGRRRWRTSVQRLCFVDSGVVRVDSCGPSVL